MCELKIAAPCGIRCCSHRWCWSLAKWPELCPGGPVQSGLLALPVVDHKVSCFPVRHVRHEHCHLLVDHQKECIKEQTITLIMIFTFTHFNILYREFCQFILMVYLMALLSMTLYGLKMAI